MSMVSLPSAGQVPASGRPVLPLPLPDTTADALWAIAAPIHHGEASRFLALGRDAGHWSRLAGLQAQSDDLAALGFAAGPKLATVPTNRPVRALRQALVAHGLSGALWRDLVRHHLADARSLFERLGPQAVLAHLRLASAIGEPLPFNGPAAEWVAQFQIQSGTKPWHLVAARWSLSTALAVKLVREGLQRLEAGTFTAFIEEELLLVAQFNDQLGSGAARARWSTLLRRARHAEATAESERRAENQHWDSGMSTLEFAGMTITALSDGVALWREGLRMHHCVGEYAERCLSDVVRVFHLDAGDGTRGWTLALRADGEGGWEVSDLRGLQNEIPSSALRFFGREWAGAYAQYLPSDPHVLDDESHEICSICGDEHCEQHLAMSTDLDEGILGGIFINADKDLEKYLKDAIAQRLLNGEPAPAIWPSEFASLHKELAKWTYEELFERVEDDWDEGVFTWEIGDAFDDAWLNINGAREVVSWIEDWLMSHHNAYAKRFEISTAPGLSWRGWNVYADDPAALLSEFNAMVHDEIFAAPAKEDA